MVQQGQYFEFKGKKYIHFETKHTRKSNSYKDNFFIFCLFRNHS